MPEDARHTQLDGLRGYAAIAVVIFHTILGCDPTLNQRIVRPPIQEARGFYDLATKFVFMLVSGETAVVLFFVLSGVVLFESLRRRRAGALATALGFSLRRFFRLYPTFFVCLVAALAAFAATGMWSTVAGHFWPNAALRDFSVLGASWTLQVEFLAIPFILAGFWCHRRFGAVGIVCVFVVFATLLCEPWLRTHFVTYKRFLPCFALGLLIPTRVGAAVVRVLPAAAWPAILGALLVVRHVFALHWWTMNLAQILAAVFVALLYYRRAGALGRFFDRALSQYLGRVSYSLYLCNVVYLVLVAHWLGGASAAREHPLEWGLVLAVPIVGASIATAHIVEIVLERPSVAWGRRLTQFTQPA